MKALLHGVDRLHAALRGDVYRALRGELVECVRAATGVAWLPLAWNVELADVIARCLGSARTRQFFRTVLMAEYESSLLKPFVAGISRAFGATPGVFVRMAPRGWELVYRQCGKLSAGDIGSAEAYLVFAELPVMCVKNTVWLDAVRSALYTGFDLSAVDGEIEWEELDLRARRAVMRFQWGA